MQNWMMSKHDCTLGSKRWEGLVKATPNPLNDTTNDLVLAKRKSTDNREDKKNRITLSHIQKASGLDTPINNDTKVRGRCHEKPMALICSLNLSYQTSNLKKCFSITKRHFVGNFVMSNNFLSLYFWFPSTLTYKDLHNNPTPPGVAVSPSPTHPAISVPFITCWRFEPCQRQGGCECVY